MKKTMANKIIAIVSATILATTCLLVSFAADPNDIPVSKTEIISANSNEKLNPDNVFKMRKSSIRMNAATYTHNTSAEDAAVINSFLNDDGTYSVFVIGDRINDNDNNYENDTYSIRKYDISAEGDISRKTIPGKLYMCVAMTKYGNHYFMTYMDYLPTSAQGQNKTAITVTEYDSDLNEIKSWNISADTPDSYIGICEPFGQSKIFVDDKYITATVSRMAFPTNGVQHQASFTFAINRQTGTKVQKNNSNAIPYCSHAMMSDIIKLNNNYFYLSLADTYPARAYALHWMNPSWTKVSSGLSTGAFSTPEHFKLANDPTYLEINSCYTIYGGMVTDGDKIIMASTYENKSDRTDIETSANLRVNIFNTTTRQWGNAIYLTDYNDNTTVINPKIFKDGKDIFILYNTKTIGTKNTVTSLRLKQIDKNGNEITDIELYKGNDYVLNRIDNILVNNHKIEWFELYGTTKFALNKFSVDISSLVQNGQNSSDNSDVSNPSEPGSSPSDVDPSSYSEEDSSNHSDPSTPSNPHSEPNTDPVTTPETTTQNSGGSSSQFINRMRNTMNKIINFFKNIGKFFARLFKII